MTCSTHLLTFNLHVLQSTTYSTLPPFPNNLPTTYLLIYSTSFLSISVPIQLSLLKYTVHKSPIYSSILLAYSLSIYKFPYLSSSPYPSLSLSTSIYHLFNSSSLLQPSFYHLCTSQSCFLFNLTFTSIIFS